MNNNPDSTGQDAAHSGGAITGPLPDQPAGTPTPPDYIPPEIRARGTSDYTGGYGGYGGTGEPTRQWNVPPQAQGQPQQGVPPYTAPPPGYAWDRGQWRRARPRTGGFVGPLILVLLGALFLLNNFGIVDWGVWTQLWRLWPLILVAIGVELLIGRRNPALSLIILLLLVAGAVAFLAYNGGFQTAGNLAQIPVGVPLQSASRASVDISFGAGHITVDGQNEGSNLATGSLDYYDGRNAPQVNSSLNGDVLQLTIKQTGESFGPFFGPGGTLNWNLHLNNRVPMTLKADTGAGNIDMDLEQLHVTDLNLSTGAGNTSVVLPSNAGAVTAKVSGGAGNLDVSIPSGVEARITASGGLGRVTVDPRFAKQGDKLYVSSGYSSAKNKVDLTVSGGVGNITINSK